MLIAAQPRFLHPIDRKTVERPAEFARQKSAAHLLVLAAVWLTFATSGVVFSEPAPIDALTMGLMVLLPVVGLFDPRPMLLTYISLWMVAAASACLASTFSYHVVDSIKHTSVTVYLYAASFVIAGFIARRPIPHMTLIYSSWLFAALVAAIAGLAGYMGLVPGAGELLTKFGRATGTFKDPNVFGAFLVAPFLYCLHIALTSRALKSMLSLGAAGLLATAVLLSFSRGAWMNLAVATALYGYLAFVTAGTAAQRRRIMALVLVSTALVATAVAITLQFDAVAKLMSERASVTQSYDVGPDGRFGGQEKAFALILENPFGIGAQQFAPVFHHEEVHNVYLSMVLNAGWLGGGVYWIMVALTLVLGFVHAMKSCRSRPLFLIAYAAFVATAFEGAIIDTDHWRHFYLLMAIVWGVMSIPREAAP